tara:strand:+ start:99 stop:281 length:183 start_codon:yes stop_codon:yes gene_type:complete
MKIISNNFKVLSYIADTQLNAMLEKQSNRYTLRRNGSPMAYISFDTLKDVSEFLTSKGRY